MAAISPPIMMAASKAPVMRMVEECRFGGGEIEGTCFFLAMSWHLNNL
jgi:hypothetical protein